jgi:hypothetical protein
MFVTASTTTPLVVPFASVAVSLTKTFFEVPSSAKLGVHVDGAALAADPFQPEVSVHVTDVSHATGLPDVCTFHVALACHTAQSPAFVEPVPLAVISAVRLSVPFEGG